MILNELKKLRVVPVVKIDDLSDALPLANALIKGGIPAAEITFRTDCAEKSISLLRSERPNMLIGAGTVLNVSQAQRAVEAGAAFIVSPGLSVEVAEFCKEKNLLYIPGCVTPTEITKALELGISTVKFFPAETFGGLKTIKALAAAFTNVSFMPTGGIDEKNLYDYLAYDKVSCCGGSFMVKSELIKSKDFDKIASLTALAKAIAIK